MAVIARSATQATPTAAIRTNTVSGNRKTRCRFNCSAADFICNQGHRFMIAEQFRTINVQPHAIPLEPVGRNTAPAIATAALFLQRQDPNALMLALPADHLIRNTSAFHLAVAHAAQIATEGYAATFGIVANSPETGFGYIRQDAAIADHPHSLHLGEFVEKPDLTTAEQAEQYAASGEYYWSSGMFLFRAKNFLDELQQLRPDILSACETALDQAQNDLDFVRLDPAAFAVCPSASIDYTVVERTQKALIWAESSLVVALGVENLMIIETADAVLIAPKDRDQNVKLIVDKLNAQDRSEHLYHDRIYRPWGWHEGIDSEDRFQVKRIMVNPGAKLSLQMHHHRAKHWVVVSGTAMVVRGEEEVILCENQSTYIPLGSKHRLENPGKVPLHLIEIQSGTYLGEDDIVHYENIYKRNA
jgi:mannose-1-phosphate guanylyltransferase / mannose-6-phosphate isomerase